MVLVFGKNGQLASDLRDLYGQMGFKNFLFLGSQDFDLRHPEGLQQKIVELRPSLIVNASAYTQVDQAESDPDSAKAVNELAVAEMARAAASLGIYLIHFSTDYVFDGSGTHAWKEEDPTGPLGQYGMSKLNGEKRIQSECQQYLIFRTSWVYSTHGKNFLKTILRLAGERETLKIVADQIGAPTFSADLAEAVWKIQTQIKSGLKPKPGIYHLANSGQCSWHEFATSIVEAAKAKGAQLKAKEILPIPASEYPTPAKRPQNSRLDLTKSAQVLGLELPPWKNSMQKCVEKLLS